MLSLSYALFLFVCYLVVLALYCRLYFRPRLYLILLGEGAYMDHYIDRLPHMRDRPDERQAMIDFMQGKRRDFFRNAAVAVGGATLAYLVLLILGAAL